MAERVQVAEAEAVGPAAVGGKGGGVDVRMPEIPVAARPPRRRRYQPVDVDVGWNHLRSPLTVTIIQRSAMLLQKETTLYYTLSL
jgi:hypothetical protein